MSQTPEENLTGDDEPEDHQSWDDFWAEVVPDRRTETIRGVEVDVPHDLPLKFSQELQGLMESEREEDVRFLVGELFGEGTMDAWITAGMTAPEFQTVLVWGIAQGQGQEITFREAYEIVRTGGKSRKPPASPRKPGGTGGRSKRTSGGSTTSRRRG